MWRRSSKDANPIEVLSSSQGIKELLLLLLLLLLHQYNTFLELRFLGFRPSN
jgi:hypothetical protein